MAATQLPSGDTSMSAGRSAENDNDASRFDAIGPSPRLLLGYSSALSKLRLTRDPAAVKQKKALGDASLALRESSSPSREPVRTDIWLSASPPKVETRAR